jgi:hypothetical protein
MALLKQTDHQKSRAKSNYLLGGVLLGFVLLVFAISVAKMIAGHNMEAPDHVLRPQLEITQ